MNQRIIVRVTFVSAEISARKGFQDMCSVCVLTYGHTRTQMPGVSDDRSRCAQTCVVWEPDYIRKSCVYDHPGSQLGCRIYHYKVYNVLRGIGRTLACRFRSKPVIRTPHQLIPLAYIAVIKQYYHAMIQNASQLPRPWGERWYDFVLHENVPRCPSF